MAHFVFSSFRLALFRLFVISLGVFSLFRLFAWRYFVLAPRHNARRKDERTKWHKQATIGKGDSKNEPPIVHHMGNFSWFSLGDDAVST